MTKTTVEMILLAVCRARAVRSVDTMTDAEILSLYAQPSVNDRKRLRRRRRATKVENLWLEARSI